MTIPFTISPPSASVSNLRMGLTNSQPLQNTTSNSSNIFNSTGTATPPLPSSSPPTITSAVSTVLSQSLSKPQPIPALPEKTNAVQGSRRRKATTPVSVI